MSWYERNRPWLERARARYAPDNPEPMVVRAWLDAPVAVDGFDPLTLEGSLQYSVILRETGRMPDDVYSDCSLEEPLEHTDIQIPIADTSMRGLPIAMVSVGWFSSDALATKRQSWKRARAEHYARDVVKVSSAENKTQMVLKATVTASFVDFFAFADRGKIQDLLRDVHCLGAARSGGLGAVHGWEVIPTAQQWWFRGPGGRLMRSLPLTRDVETMTGVDARSATLRAPYWHPRTRRLCGVPAQRLGEPLGDAAGDFFVTSHAVQRYKERVPGARGLSYHQALSELIGVMKRSHRVKSLGNGLDLWRGPKPHRLRIRVAPSTAGFLPQVVTVLRGCDPGWQR